MLDVTLVGLGAIGHGVLAALERDACVRVAQAVVPAADVAAVRSEFPAVAIAARLDDLPATPSLLLECAGHQAVLEHVLPALAGGVDCIVCSIGALAERGLPERLEAAAHAGGSRLRLVSGAIGGLDALASAQVGGLTRVVYSGRKPPSGWKGTPAERAADLDTLDHPITFFDGTARDAARQFPKNANVTASVSLAGIGLDATRVQLIADPAASRNVHHVFAEGAFGEMEITLAGFPLPANPKTSALAVYSAVRALRDRVAAFTF